MPEPLPHEVDTPTYAQDIVQQLQALTQEQRQMQQLLEQMSKSQDAAASTAESIREHMAELSSRLLKRASSMESANSSAHPTLTSPSQVPRAATWMSSPESHEYDGSMRSDESILSAPLGTSLSALTLPPRWPASIEVRPAFEVKASECMSVSELHREMLARTMTAERLPQSPSTVEAVRLDWNHVLLCGVCRFQAVSPNNPYRMTFELAGFVILLLDLSLMPYVLAWDVASETWYVVLNFLMSSFWTVDMVLNFFSGFYQDGDLQLVLDVIARTYVRTWFGFDLAIVLSDWTSLLILATFETEGLTSVKMLRFLKISRVLRGAGVLRMVRVARIIGDYLDRTLTEGSRLLLKFVAAFFCVLWVNHVVCCTWWVIGMGARTDTGLRWVSTSLPGGFIYEEMPTLFQYTTSFHWSIAQLTLGAVEINPVNSVERMYTVGLLVLGLLVGISLVSLLSAEMMDFTMRKQDRVQKMSYLRTFLAEHHVNSKLAYRVTQQAETRIRKRAKLTDRDVDAIQLLSSTLRTELRYEIFQRQMSSHPLFRLWGHLSEITAGEFCAEAVGAQYMNKGDVLFRAGDEGVSAYYLEEGSVQYKQIPQTSPVQDEMVTPVGEDTWLSEAALWMEWIHVGSPEVDVPAKLLTVNSDRMLKAMMRHGLITVITIAYARIYHGYVISAVGPDGFPSDVPGDSDDFKFWNIVSRMSHELQEAISLHAIQTAANVRMTHRGKNQFQVGFKHYQRLKEQVLQGSATLLLTNDGGLQRVVNVMRFRMSREDGRVLMALGKQHHMGQMIPNFALPGQKIHRDESRDESLHRFLNNRLESRFRVGQHYFSYHVDEGMSKTYNLPTVYRIVSCFAEGEVKRTQDSSSSVDHESLELPSCPIDAKWRNWEILTCRDGGAWYIYAWIPSEEVRNFENKADAASSWLAGWLKDLLAKRMHLLTSTSLSWSWGTV